MDTHYLLKLTTLGPDGRQRAACGVFVHAAGHSVEPSCAACQRYLNSGPRPETSVVVTEVTPLALPCRSMDSIHTYPDATADLFEPDVLTITSLHDGAVIKVYPIDRWRLASVISGSGGHYAFSFQNKTMQADDLGWSGHVESRERRRSA